MWVGGLRVRGQPVRRVGVDGRDEGEVVLVLVEVGGRGCRGGVVERVRQRGEEGAEGEFVDVVREVECCLPRQPVPATAWGLRRGGQPELEAGPRKDLLEWSRWPPQSMYPWPLAVT